MAQPFSRSPRCPSNQRRQVYCARLSRFAVIGMGCFQTMLAWSQVRSCGQKPRKCCYGVDFWLNVRSLCGRAGSRIAARGRSTVMQQFASMTGPEQICLQLPRTHNFQPTKACSYTDFFGCRTLQQQGPGNLGTPRSCNSLTACMQNPIPRGALALALPPHCPKCA